MRDAPARVLFLNSGILGHRTVGALFREVAAFLPRVDAVHTDLSADLKLTDRVARRLLSLRFAPSRGVAANVDLRRWREELNVGLLAARRIAQLERQRGPFDLLHFHTQASVYASLGRMRQTPCIVSIDCTQCLASREAESTVSRASYLPNIVHDAFVFRRARRSPRHRDGQRTISSSGIPTARPRFTSCLIRSVRSSRNRSSRGGSNAFAPIRMGAFTSSSSAATSPEREDRNCWMPGKQAGSPATPSCAW